MRPGGPRAADRGRRRPHLGKRPCCAGGGSRERPGGPSSSRARPPSSSAWEPISGSASPRSGSSTPRPTASSGSSSPASASRVPWNGSARPRSPSRRSTCTASPPPACWPPAGLHPAVDAGHSLGEYSALTAAGRARLPPGPGPCARAGPPDAGRRRRAAGEDGRRPRPRRCGRRRPVRGDRSAGGARQLQRPRPGGPVRGRRRRWGRPWPPRRGAGARRVRRAAGERRLPLPPDGDRRRRAGGATRDDPVPASVGSGGDQRHRRPRDRPRGPETSPPSNR